MTSTVATPAESPSQQYTILRIKRKRHEEPITALFYDIESKSPSKERDRKKIKVGGEIGSESGLFRLAETVDERTWEATKNGLRVEELRDRINASKQADSPSKETANDHLAISGPQAEGPESSSDMDVDAPRRVYRILPRRRSAMFPLAAKRESGKGAMATVSETDQDMTSFDLLEAELVPEKPLSKERIARDPSKAKQRQTNGINIVPTGASEVEERDMALFADMVERFLQVNTDVLEAPRPLKRPSRVQTNVNSEPESLNEDSMSNASVNGSTPAQGEIAKDANGLGAGSDDDYVYDIFYYSPESAGRVQMMKMLNRGQVGALTGIDELYEPTGESDSDEEVDSEVDEDSNDEAYYRNDYPDEDEDLSEDEDGERRERFESGDYIGASWEDADDDWHDPDSD